MRRALVLVIGLAIVGFVAPQTAQAADFDPDAIIFPVQGDNYFSDTWGAARSNGRTHEGVDIMTYGVKGVPVVAAADGVVRWIGSTCCYLSIDHGGGWETWYIHLNDDAQDSEGNYIDFTDGQGWGIAPGIERGAAVEAGQLIGWVGDSGNAAEGMPHLHFEIRRNGSAINPYPYAYAASLRPIVYNGQFYDDDDSIFENDIEKFYAAGITRGCNPPENDRYCVNQAVSRGAMAAFIRRWFELPSADVDYFADDNGTLFESDINALTAAGIGFGCSETEYCSEDPLLREEFAEMFTRAFGYTNPDGIDWFVDDDGSAFEESINALRVAGVTMGCNPPTNDDFCPTLPVDRGAMAAFFVRALDL